MTPLCSVIPLGLRDGQGVHTPQKEGGGQQDTWWGLGENELKLGGFSGWLRGPFQLFSFNCIWPTDPQVWYFQLITLNSLLTDKPIADLWSREGLSLW